MENRNAPKIPYTVQMGVASAHGKDELVCEIIQEALQKISKRILDDIIYKYDHVDLPLVLATMKITTSGLETTLDREEKGFVDDLVSQTKCITIDATELKRQAKEEKNNG